MLFGDRFIFPMMLTFQEAVSSTILVLVNQRTEDLGWIFIKDKKERNLYLYIFV